MTARREKGRREPRVVAYFDGLNLNYALQRGARLRHLQWLDPSRLASNLVAGIGRLVGLHYFTAPLGDFRNRRGWRRDQRAHLDALATVKGLELHLGYHLEKRATCSRCGSQHRTFEEKLTDVKIALQVLCDAEDDRFDTALLVTADSDLAAVIETVRERHPSKQVMVAFPPGRYSHHLAHVASRYLHVWGRTLQRSQLPDVIDRANGGRLARPRRWRR